MKTLKQILKDSGFEFSPETNRDDGGLVVMLVRDFLEEKKQEIWAKKDFGYIQENSLINDLLSKLE